MAERGAVARLAALLAAATLAACSSVPQRGDGSAAHPLPDGHPVAVVPLGEAPPAPVAANSTPADDFAAFQSRLGRLECDDDALVREWRKRYSPAWPHFANAMDRALPALLFVAEQLQERDLPAEFALLPVVESWYQAIPGRGDNPAGFWQFTRATARDYGLVIDRRDDQRLDLVPSSRAAVAHLAALAEEFDRNWLLVDYAYNAGHFTVLTAQKRGSFERVRATMPRTTKEHWAKLCALSGILRDPESHLYRPKLPPPERRLVAWVAPSDLDWQLLVAASGESLEALRDFNAGSPATLVPGGSSLALPASAAARMDAVLAVLPNEERVGWRKVGLASASTLLALAQDDAAVAERLAQINRAAPDQTLPAGSSVWLRVPGAAASTPTPVPTPAPATADSARSTDGERTETYVVRSGDSLWTIARRFGISVEQLRAVNGLRRDALSIGQRLRLQGDSRP